MSRFKLFLTWVQPRLKLLLIWAFCCVIMPILLIAMFFQALSGSATRALNMMIAVDEVGNSLFGGDPRMTISTRTGNGLIEGLAWAKMAAVVIDFIFGKGHCLANATLPFPDSTTPTTPVPDVVATPTEGV